MIDLNPNKCPCGTGKEFSTCCDVFISHHDVPISPEALMRSRYTAYSKANIPYIIETMKSPASDNFDATEAEWWAKTTQWQGLEVITTSENGNTGRVEFVANYSLDGTVHRLHEISEFRLDDGRWYYVNGVYPSHVPIKNLSEKIGRNDTCLCGSGKKFTKCCQQR